MVGRLIPARAGKTALIALTPSPIAAHPRACGENDHAGRVGGGEQGSSPRVRGKLADALVLELAARLIPARAGKTLSLPV